MVEASEGRPDQSLATFLWKAELPVTHVVILSELLHGWWWNSYSDSCLLRLADSNVYYRTFLVPNDLCCLYKLVPNMPLIHPADAEDKIDLVDLVATAVADPLNKHTETDWTTRSVLRLPNAPDERWAERNPQTPQGSLFDCPQAFSGLSTTQRLRIYLPGKTAGAGKIERLLVMFDVDTSINDVRVPVIADNLIAAGRIPPTAIVFIDPSDDRAVSLICSTSAAQAIAYEVVPWMRDTYGLTNRPEDTVVAGGSLGGLMALYVGFNYPDVFGTVVSQAGGFMFSPERAMGSDWDHVMFDEAGNDWLTQQIASKPVVPIRVAMDIGTLEHKRDGIMHGLIANRHMRDVLTAKGYPLRYREYCGGHQYIHWRATLPDSLIWALN